MAFEFTDRRADPGAWARQLGISREAIDLFASSDTIDLHIESFLWTRAAGYDLSKRHGTGLFDARLYSQADFPRALESGMTGGVWSIATNVFRRRKNRTPTALANLERLRSIIEAHPAQMAVVADHAGYVRARKGGKYACWLALQGGNALDDDPGDIDRLPGDVVSRITLVHMSNSSLGRSNSPFGSDLGGLTDAGRDYVRRMDSKRILLDLSHINREGFFDALAVHARSLPAIVSHTGVRGVCDMWRNIDDSQIKAIADTGGVVGIIYHTSFLGEPYWGGRASAIVDHLEHVVRVAGDDFAALGSDWDGLICTPRDMKTVLELPVLVQRMLDRGWGEGRVRKVLGGNYLRVMRAIRPGS